MLEKRRIKIQQKTIERLTNECNMLREKLASYKNIENKEKQLDALIEKNNKYLNQLKESIASAKEARKLYEENAKKYKHLVAKFSKEMTIFMNGIGASDE